MDGDDGRAGREWALLQPLGAHDQNARPPATRPERQDAGRARSHARRGRRATDGAAWRQSKTYARQDCRPSRMRGPQRGGLLTPDSLAEGSCSERQASNLRATTGGRAARPGSRLSSGTGAHQVGQVVEDLRRCGRRGRGRWSRRARGRRAQRSWSKIARGPGEGSADLLLELGAQQIRARRAWGLVLVRDFFGFSARAAAATLGGGAAKGGEVLKW